jgi:germination protein M
MRLTETAYEPSAETFEEMMDELMGQMALTTTTYVSALTNGVRYTGYERGIDALRVDFSSEYYQLDQIQEVLLRAAVVKTLSQIPGVTKVMITVDGEQLTDADGEPVAPMDAGSFIDTQEGGINSYLYATLCLYFADEETQQLTEETRSLNYSSNMVLERLVMEQLIEGPQEKGHQALFNKNVKIQSLYIQDGICTIMFDEEANKAPSENSPDPETTLRAVAYSIIDTCDDITGVRFEIDGDSDELFRDEVQLDQVFTLDESVSEE